MALICGFGHGVAGCVDVIDVVASASGHGVISFAAVQNVIAVAAIYDVVATMGTDKVVAGSAINVIDPLAGKDFVIAAIAKDDLAVAILAVDLVSVGILIALGHGIVALGPVHRIGVQGDIGCVGGAAFVFDRIGENGRSDVARRGDCDGAISVHLQDFARIQRQAIAGLNAVSVDLGDRNDATGRHCVIDQRREYGFAQGRQVDHIILCDQLCLDAVADDQQVAVIDRITGIGDPEADGVNLAPCDVSLDGQRDRQTIHFRVYG